MIVMESYTRKDIEEQFLQAAGRGDLDAVGRMLSAGVFVDATDELFRQVGSLFDAFHRFHRLVTSLHACMVPVRFKPVISNSCPFTLSSWLRCRPLFKRLRMLATLKSHASCSMLEPLSMLREDMDVRACTEHA